MGNIIPPCSGSTTGSLPSWMCPEDQGRCPRKTLIRWPNYRSWLLSTWRRRDSTPHPISKDEPNKSQEETHFSKLYLQCYSFNHYPKRMAIGEGWEVFNHSWTTFRDTYSLLVAATQKYTQLIMCNHVYLQTIKIEYEYQKICVFCQVAEVGNQVGNQVIYKYLTHTAYLAIKARLNVYGHINQLQLRVSINSCMLICCYVLHLFHHF